MRFLLTLAALLAGPSFAQTLNFTAATTTGVESVVPDLSWSTTPAAQSCTATGPTAWAGTKQASGTQTLPAITVDATYVLTCTWPANSTMALSWTAPTQNTNGTAYTNPKDYIVKWRYGTGALTDTTPCTAPVSCATVQSPATSYTITGLNTAGTVYATVVVRNSLDITSAASTPVSKVISATGASVNRSVAITVNARPNPVTGLTAE
jgi:hypothetical protein